MQAARDLPLGSLEERLQRDKTLLQVAKNSCTQTQTTAKHFTSPPTHLDSYPFFQVNSAFVRAVTQGAETVVDGYVEPVNGNPDDPAFLWGGLFMSQGAEVGIFGGERGRR